MKVFEWHLENRYPWKLNLNEQYIPLFISLFFSARCWRCWKDWRTNDHWSTAFFLQWSVCENACVFSTFLFVSQCLCEQFYMCEFIIRIVEKKKKEANVIIFKDERKKLRFFNVCSEDHFGLLVLLLQKQQQ